MRFWWEMNAKSAKEWKGFKPIDQQSMNWLKARRKIKRNSWKSILLSNMASRIVRTSVKNPLTSTSTKRSKKQEH